MTSQLEESREDLEDERLEYHHFFITEDLWHIFAKLIYLGAALGTLVLLLIFTIQLEMNSLNMLKLFEAAVVLYCAIFLIIMANFLYYLRNHGRSIEFECIKQPDNSLKVLNFRMEDVEK